jgi:hypothetical protein
MKKEKYQISYTLKRPGDPFYHYKFFFTKKDANAWLKANKKNLYWHQFTEINPKSDRPKPMIDGDLSSSFKKKVGVLQTYFETGMESLGLIFCEDGIHGNPNPNFDPNKPEDRDNFQYFSSWDAITFIATGQVIEFANGEKVGMAKDREFAKKDGYRISFYPQGYSKKEWLDLFATEKLQVTLWIPESKHEKDLKKFIRGPF